MRPLFNFVPLDAVAELHGVDEVYIHKRKMGRIGVWLPIGKILFTIFQLPVWMSIKQDFGKVFFHVCFVEAKKVDLDIDFMYLEYAILLKDKLRYNAPVFLAFFRGPRIGAILGQSIAEACGRETCYGKAFQKTVKLRVIRDAEVDLCPVRLATASGDVCNMVHLYRRWSSHSMQTSSVQTLC